MPVETELALRRMIGVPADGSVDELRSAYDRAMHRATRSGDHQHALALSQAYDRLPPATRDALYPSSRARASLPVATAPRRTRRLGRGRPRRRGRGRLRRARPFVLAAVGAAVLVLAVLGVARHYEHRPAGARPVTVPTSAPTGRNGLVTLLCEPRPGAAGYSMTAPRGAVVTCGNGSTPTVVG